MVYLKTRFIKVDGNNKTITMVGESQTTIMVGTNRMIMDGVSKVVITMDGDNPIQIMIGETIMATIMDGDNRIIVVGVMEMETLIMVGD